MKEDKKGLTLNGLTRMNVLFIINAFAMIGVSIKLINQYYDTHYPKDPFAGPVTICNLSSFLNCDAATNSQLAAFAGVPIAYLGLIMGSMFLFSSFIPTESNEKTANAFSKFNLIGCLLLFSYSIGFLGSLCPLCTIYYLLSALAAYLLWRGGNNTWIPNFKISAIWGSAFFLIFYYNIENCIDCTDDPNSPPKKEVILKKYKNLTDLKDPAIESPFKIHMSTKNFSDAPIRISIFSDFECPFCKVLAEQITKLKFRYGDHLNVQYYFYPLDKKCNKNVSEDFHKYACEAAELAACQIDNFSTFHDEIFENQKRIKDGFLVDFAKKNNLKECIDRDVNMNLIHQSIAAADQYQIKSTPTIIINGRKIEGAPPFNYYSIIFDGILKESNLSSNSSR